MIFRNTRYHISARDVEIPSPVSILLPSSLDIGELLEVAARSENVRAIDDGVAVVMIVASKNDVDCSRL